MDPEKKSLNFIFPTKYVIPKSLKFSHWPSKLVGPIDDLKHMFSTETTRYNRIMFRFQDACFQEAGK